MQGIWPIDTKSGTGGGDNIAGNKSSNISGSGVCCSCGCLSCPYSGQSYTWCRCSDVFFCRQEQFPSGRQRQQQKQLQWCFWQAAQLLLLASAAVGVFITRSHDKRGIEFKYAPVVQRLISASTWEKPSGKCKLHW